MLKAAIAGCLIAFPLQAALTPNTQGMPGSSSPTSTKPSVIKRDTKALSPKPYESKLPPKPLLPVMEKAFGMPGVAGWQNGKWEHSDYLGLLSSHISVGVEVLKGDKVPPIDESALQREAKEILVKASMTPRADAEEGPPLPFFHLLIFVYPADADRYVVFANGRLFEQVEVKRQNFEPKGYWQAITWETQDLSNVTGKELQGALKTTTEKILKDFTKRYREYNPINPDTPKPPPVKSGSDGSSVSGKSG